MGIAKKTDGRYVVGVGVDNANDYKGSAAYRDIYIQLTASGATAKSEEYLTFLKDYGFHANASGEPIMPPSVNVWISNNGVTTAVEADDVSIDGNNYTICGIKWNGSAWDYSNAGQGHGGGGGLPSYTSADKGKVLALGEDAEHPVEQTIVPEQSVSTGNTGTYYDGTKYYSAEITDADFSGVSVGDTVVITVDGTDYECTVTTDDGQLLMFSSPVAFGITAGSYGNHFLSTTKETTYSVSASILVPTSTPMWKTNGVVLELSNAAITHLQTKVQAALTSFFASAANVKYYDRTANVLTDDDLTTINTVYAEMSAGNTNVVLSSLGVLFPVATSASDTAMFVLPYYSQTYSTIVVAARITIILFSAKSVVVVAEKLYDSRS